MEEKLQIYLKYFQEHISKSIKPLEDERKNIASRLILSSILFFLFGIFFAFLFFYNAVNYVFNPFVLPILLFFTYFFILKSISSLIYESREFKRKLLKLIWPMFCRPVANFKPWPLEPDLQSVINSKLFPNFDAREDEFSFLGVYKDTNIIISETKLTLPSRGTTKPNLFKGTLIQLELPFSVENHVILSSKNEKIFNKYKRVKSNIKEIDDSLNVFAKNDTDIINSSLWEVLKKLGALYSAAGFLMSINNNTVLIAISRKKPLYFGSLFCSLCDFDVYKNLVKRFIVIYELIDLD